MENIKQEAIMFWISVSLVLIAFGILIYASKYQPPKVDKAYNFCMELMHNTNGYNSSEIDNCQNYLGIKIIKNN